jgi:hypothetical protein
MVITSCFSSVVSHEDDDDDMIVDDDDAAAVAAGGSALPLPPLPSSVHPVVAPLTPPPGRLTTVQYNRDTIYVHRACIYASVYVCVITVIRISMPFVSLNTPHPILSTIIAIVLFFSNIYFYYLLSLMVGLIGWIDRVCVAMSSW